MSNSVGRQHSVIVPYDVITLTVGKSKKILPVYYAIMKRAKRDKESPLYVNSISVAEIIEEIGMKLNRSKNGSVRLVMSAINDLEDCGVLVERPDFNAFKRFPVNDRFTYKIDIKSGKSGDARSAYIRPSEFNRLRANTGARVRYIGPDGKETGIQFGVSLDNALLVLCVIRSYMPKKKDRRGLPRATTVTREYISDNTGICQYTVGDAVSLLNKTGVLYTKSIMLKNKDNKPYNRTFFANYEDGCEDEVSKAISLFERNAKGKVPDLDMETA